MNLDKWGRSLSFAAIAILVLIVGAVVLQNTAQILDSRNFRGDHRTLYHFSSSKISDSDYVATFLKAQPQPLLYKSINRYADSIGIELPYFHRVLTLINYFLFIAGMTLLGLRFGGAVFSLFLVFVVVAQPLYLLQISFATPHSFAFPLLVFAFVFLLYERRVALVVCTLVSGLLYTPISLSIYALLSWSVVTSIKRSELVFRELALKVCLLGSVGTIIATLLWQRLLPIEGYGDPISLDAVVENASQHDGNTSFIINLEQPMLYVFALIGTQFREYISGSWIMVLLLIYFTTGAYGFAHAPTKHAYGKNLWGFVIPSVLLFLLMYILKPYLSYRFILYPLLTLLPLLFVYGVFHFITSNCKSTMIQFGSLLGLAVINLAIFASTDTKKIGYTLALDQHSEALMEFIERLPKATAIAAWPIHKRTDMISYVTGKQLFVNSRFHALVNYDHARKEMDQRMDALINAYFSTSIEPVNYLYCNWGVNLLIVDSEHFGDIDNIPIYFEPFQSVIQSRIDLQKPSQFFFNDLPNNPVIFESGTLRVIDIPLLSKYFPCGDSEDKFD